MKTDYPTIENIHEVAVRGAKQRWETFYDALADVFYWKKPVLSKKARLVGLSHQVSLYVTSEGEIEGIFIEMFQYHFLKEHRELAEMKKNVQGYMPETLIEKFSESVIKDIEQDGQGQAMLEKLVI